MPPGQRLLPWRWPEHAMEPRPPKSHDPARTYRHPLRAKGQDKMMVNLPINQAGDKSRLLLNRRNIV
jgi:hypothetical protein